jgi:ribonucleoside-diphosphate reductase alpha chain
MTKFSNNNKTENNTRSDKLRYLELNSQIMNKKDGFFQIEKDKEALLLFLEEVKENSLTFNNNIDKIEYLIFNGFYDNFFDNYSKEEISKIYEIVYSYNFQFVSYMSASKFYRDYALKTDDKSKYLEHYEDRIVAVSLHLAVNDIEKAINFATSMIKQHYQPATPTFLNAGKKRRGELISCFLLELDDSLNSISFNLSTSMYLSKIGGGVALNLSKLRARGESIKVIKNA